MKKLFFGIIALFAVSAVHAQSLEKMNWFNEPAEWRVVDKHTFEMTVPAKTDY